MEGGTVPAIVCYGSPPRFISITRQTWARSSHDRGQMQLKNVLSQRSIIHNDPPMTPHLSSCTASSELGGLSRGSWHQITTADLWTGHRNGRCHVWKCRSSHAHRLCQSSRACFFWRFQRKFLSHSQPLDIRHQTPDGAASRMH
jgi:hypothetical protein